MPAFPDTHWSVVLAAQGDGLQARSALECLCRVYWPPVYHYIRQRGNSHADAEDLTQGFFASLLERGSLDSVAAEKGRLRTFLLTAAARFMANEHERASAQKRGGQAVHLPLEADWSEGRPPCDPGHALTPDLAFERAWALRLLDRVFEALRTHAESSGQGALFAELRGLIAFEPPPASYEEIANRLETTPAAVKAAAHRLRRRYRDELHRLIAETVAEPDEVDDELNHLLTVFADPGRP